MALTYGFYDSVGGDRTYNAEQFSRFFDGIISDGIIKAVGSHFQVTAGTGLAVKVGSGRAWFNHTWTYNDSDITITLPAAHATLPRIDSIILSIDEQARTNTITYKQGTAASNPVAPTLTNNETLHEYRLANIEIAATATSITTANITQIVGESETPYATLSDMNIDYNTVANRPSINGVLLTGNKTTANLGISYNDLANRPSINGVTLSGNKTTSNLNISYNDLSDRPSINGVTLSGNKTTANLAISYNDLTNRPTLNDKTITGAINWAPGALNSKNKVTVTHSVSIKDHTYIRYNGSVQIPSGVNGQTPRRIAIVGASGSSGGPNMEYDEHSGSSMIYNQQKTDNTVGSYMRCAYAEIIKCAAGTGKSSSDSGFVGTYLAKTVAGYFDTDKQRTASWELQNHVQQYAIYSDSYTDTTSVMYDESVLFDIRIGSSRKWCYGPGLIDVSGWGSRAEWYGQFGNISWEGTTLRYSYYFDRNGSDWWFDGQELDFYIYVLE